MSTPLTTTSSSSAGSATSSKSSSSMRIRQSFDFDFGAFPVPASPSLPLKQTKETKETKETKDSKDSKDSKRFSTLPDSMTHADHQLAGEYRSMDGTFSLKITYRHVLIKRENEPTRRCDMELLNPFVLKCRAYDGWYFGVRDTPNGLYWIHLATTVDEHDFGASSTKDEIFLMQKTTVTLDKKCHFAYHSIRNLFDSMQAENPVISLSFSAKGLKRTSHRIDPKTHNVLNAIVEPLNPLSCHVSLPDAKYWYFCDIRHLLLIELLYEHRCLEMNVYEITSVPDSTRLLLTASPYFATTPHTDQTDPSAQTAHTDADIETF